MPRRLPSLNALRAFEAAARHLSFTRAAEELSVTQTAVSHQVKYLEERLGFRLFRRLNNTLVLTDKGEAYLPVLREAFDRIAEGTEQIQSDQAVKELTVSVQPNFALRWLIPRLPGFQARHPRIELRIFTAYRALDFLREEIDVAVRIGDEWPGLNCDFLFAAEMFPVCSPALARTRSLTAPSDLESNTLLHVYYSPEDWRIWLTAAGLPTADHLRGPRFDSYALAVEAALHGCGVTMGRGPFVEEDIKAGRLIVPFDLRIKRDKAWYLIWPKSNLTWKVAAFRSWLLEEAAKTRERQG